MDRDDLDALLSGARRQAERRASEAAQAGDWQTVKREYSFLASARPHDAALALASRGLAELHLEEYAAARSDAKRALELAPGDAKVEDLAEYVARQVPRNTPTRELTLDALWEGSITMHPKTIWVTPTSTLAAKARAQAGTPAKGQPDTGKRATDTAPQPAKGKQAMDAPSQQSSDSEVLDIWLAGAANRSHVSECLQAHLRQQAPAQEAEQSSGDAESAAQQQAAVQTPYQVRPAVEPEKKSTGPNHDSRAEGQFVSSRSQTALITVDGQKLFCKRTKSAAFAEHEARVLAYSMDCGLAGRGCVAMHGLIQLQPGEYWLICDAVAEVFTERSWCSQTQVSALIHAAVCSNACGVVNGDPLPEHAGWIPSGNRGNAVLLDWHLASIKGSRCVNPPVPEDARGIEDNYMQPFGRILDGYLRFTALYASPLRHLGFGATISCDLVSILFIVAQYNLGWWALPWAKLQANMDVPQTIGLTMEAKLLMLSGRLWEMNGKSASAEAQREREQQCTAAGQAAQPAEQAAAGASSSTEPARCVWGGDAAYQLLLDRAFDAQLSAHTPEQFIAYASLARALQQFVLKRALPEGEALQKVPDARVSPPGDRSGAYQRPMHVRSLGSTAKRLRYVKEAASVGQATPSLASTAALKGPTAPPAKVRPSPNVARLISAASQVAEGEVKKIFDQVKIPDEAKRSAFDVNLGQYQERSFLQVADMRGQLPTTIFDCGSSRIFIPSFEQELERRPDGLADVVTRTEVDLTGTASAAVMAHLPLYRSQDAMTRLDSDVQSAALLFHRMHITPQGAVQVTRGPSERRGARLDAIGELVHSGHSESGHAKESQLNAKLATPAGHWSPLMLMRMGDGIFAAALLTMRLDKPFAAVHDKRKPQRAAQQRSAAGSAGPSANTDLDTGGQPEAGEAQQRAKRTPVERFQHLAGKLERRLRNNSAMLPWLVTLATVQRGLLVVAATSSSLGAESTRDALMQHLLEHVEEQQQQQQQQSADLKALDRKLDMLSGQVERVLAAMQQPREQPVGWLPDRWWRRQPLRVATQAGASIQQELPSGESAAAVHALSGPTTALPAVEPHLPLPGSVETHDVSGVAEQAARPLLAALERGWFGC